jgi:type II secretory pathway pseudopilin PulG
MTSFSSVTPASPKSNDLDLQPAPGLPAFGPPYPMRAFKRRPGFVRQSGLNSFTLVEVVFAIALIAFVLISVLGLMTYASQLVQQADTYSRLSNVVGQVSAKYDSQPYSVSTNYATTNMVYYFTSEGLPTNKASAYYQCNVTNADLSTWTLTNVMQIQMTITWPQPRPTSTNIVITSTLNYD